MKMFRLVLVSLLFMAFNSCKTESSDIGKLFSSEEPQDSESTSSEWEILFDGTNFDAWRGYLMEEMPAEWIIEDGAMAFTPGNSGSKNLITKQQFNSFSLSLEWKISEGGNSGIFYGVHEDPRFREPYQTGVEIQVLDDERHPDAKLGNGTHVAGSLYDMIGPSEKVVKPAGGWNLCEITVNHQTNKGSIILNGVNIVNFPVNGADWETMVENSKFKGWEGFGTYQTGHIGLQDHGNKVWYRNIKVKRLD